MKIFCTRLVGFKYNPWEGGFVAAAKRALGAAGGPYRLAEEAEEADMIIVFESNRDKTARDIRRYERDAWVRRYPERLFTINYEPYPAGFLPGLYIGSMWFRWGNTRGR